MKWFGLLVLGVAACTGSTAGDSGDEQDVTRARRPIVELLQYAGAYDETPGGDFGRIELLDNGTFRHFDPHLGVSTGRYSGPSRPEGTGTGKLPLKLNRLSATLGPDDAFGHAVLAITLADGKQITLTSAFPLVGEEGCDRSGGQFTDDDADPATGLFCICTAPAKFVHAAGGCTK